jgi:hypothetical protein
MLYKASKDRSPEIFANDPLTSHSAPMRRSFFITLGEKQIHVQQKYTVI